MTIQQTRVCHLALLGMVWPVIRSRLDGGGGGGCEFAYVGMRVWLMLEWSGWVDERE